MSEINEYFSTKLFQCMSDCMQKAIDENPEEAKNWTQEELFFKGAIWAGKHIIINVEDEPE